VVNDKSPLQRYGSSNYICEANYIEFAGVKVHENYLMIYPEFVSILCFYVLIASVFQVVTPSGNVLVDNLTLRVESGSNLLITGSLFDLRESLFGVISFYIFFALCLLALSRIIKSVLT
jgi:hypothetical protein